MQEIWKPVKDYEHLYVISNYGDVKSLDKKWKAINYKSNTYHEIHLDGRKLRPSISKCGYKQVNLSKNNKVYGKLVHRLVAEAFIPNLDNKPCVNHKDGNKLNNCVSNLEWCTYKENSRHSWDNGLQKSYLKGKYGEKSNVAKPIFQYDLDGNLIKEWGSISDAARALNIDVGRITKCCKKQKYCHSAGGYKWEYKTLLKKGDNDGRRN